MDPGPVDAAALVPLPRLTTRCGDGLGVAFCPTLGMLVASAVELAQDSDSDSDFDYDGEAMHSVLRVFSLLKLGLAPGDSPALAPVCTLQGDFSFVDGSGYSGFLAFAGPPSARALLVTDHVHDVVHVMGMERRAHVGHVAEPGVIRGPRGVAARGSLVAVSAWKWWYTGDHLVQLFEGAGGSWTLLRTLAGGLGRPSRADGQLDSPCGLRFTCDGTGLVVADRSSGRICLFRVEDGSFVRHVATGLAHPWDVQECDGLKGGWVVACWGSPTLVRCGSVDSGGAGWVGVSGPLKRSQVSCLASVPGLGLAARDIQGFRLLFLAAPDTIAMASMSPHRVGWMVAVARSALWSASILK